MNRFGYKTILFQGLLSIAVASVLPMAVAAQEMHGESMDCMNCHSCPNPTKENPCLRVCPRHEMDVVEEVVPDIVILDALEDLYVPVRFNHKAHSDMVTMASGCETCHHFTPEGQPHAKCISCHPQDIIHEDIAQPGLKGAYHRQCLGCHTEWDKDTACEVCHEKKAGGRLNGTATKPFEHSHYQPIEMKELIVFNTEFDENDKVPFHHKNHAQLYMDWSCSSCHQQQGCKRCHVHDEELHPMGQLAEIDLHDVCFTCHGDEDCGFCHGRNPDDLFVHDSTGWPLKQYHTSLRCRQCHKHIGEFEKLSTDCVSCHTDGWNSQTFDHKIVAGVPLDEMHSGFDCTDCHEEGVGTKGSCTICHEDPATMKSDEAVTTQ